MPSIAWFNDLDADSAAAALHACCASPAWIQQIAGGRPYASSQALASAGRTAAQELPWNGVLDALTAHPRIGNQVKGSAQEATWSRGEQSGVRGASEQVVDELAKANLAYETRFGHVFLICATGLSAAEMLAAAKRRLDNDPATEQAETTTELAKIVELRLSKLVAA